MICGNYGVFYKKYSNDNDGNYAYDEIDHWKGSSNLLQITFSDFISVIDCYQNQSTKQPEEIIKEDRIGKTKK